MSFDLQAWAAALVAVNEDAKQIPVSERSDETAKPFQARAMRLVLELVDALGDFARAKAAVVTLKEQFADAVVYRWPVATVEAGVEGLASARAEGRLSFGQELTYGPDGSTDREIVQEQADEIVDKVAALLATEDDAAS